MKRESLPLQHPHDVWGQTMLSPEDANRRGRRRKKLARTSIEAATSYADIFSSSVSRSQARNNTVAQVVDHGEMDELDAMMGWRGDDAEQLAPTEQFVAPPQETEFVATPTVLPAKPPQPLIDMKLLHDIESNFANNLIFDGDVLCEMRNGQWVQVRGNYSNAPVQKTTDSADHRTVNDRLVPESLEQQGCSEPNVESGQANVAAARLAVDRLARRLPVESPVVTVREAPIQYRVNRPRVKTADKLKMTAGKALIRKDQVVNEVKSTYSTLNNRIHQTAARVAEVSGVVGNRIASGLDKCVEVLTIPSSEYVDPTIQAAPRISGVYRQTSSPEYVASMVKEGKLYRRYIPRKRYTGVSSMGYQHIMYPEFIQTDVLRNHKLDSLELMLRESVATFLVDANNVFMIRPDSDNDWQGELHRGYCVFADPTESKRAFKDKYDLEGVRDEARIIDAFSKHTATLPKGWLRSHEEVRD